MDGAAANGTVEAPLPSEPERWWSGEAIVSIVCGVVAVPLFFALIPAAIAIAYGFVAVRNCNADAACSGRAMAITGVVLGVIAVLAGVIFWLSFWSAYPFETD